MKICTALLAILIININLFSQSPGGFNYQAVVRDANNKIVANSLVGIQISIKQGSAKGPTVYQETFSPYSNDYGLINLEIGKGTVISGAFSAIDWANGPYFLETAMDISGGSNYVVMGTSQLRSVPYALHAGVAESLAEKKYRVGDRAEGGIVFYVNEERTHGLVAAFADQPRSVNWYESKNNMNNPEFQSGGSKQFMDWRQPSKYELNLMYERKNVIGNFTRNDYWSSIEAENGSNAWSQNFETGEQKIQQKTKINSVRLIRSF